MRKLLFLFFVLVSPLSRAQVSEACEWRELVRQVDGMTAIEGDPPIARSDRGKFISISLYEPIGSTDQYLYSALVDPNSGQAWIRRYGGLTGVIVWFGPTAAAADRLSSCPAARYPVWFG